MTQVEASVKPSEHPEATGTRGRARGTGETGEFRGEMQITTGPGHQERFDFYPITREGRSFEGFKQGMFSIMYTLNHSDCHGGKCRGKEVSEKAI